MEHLFSDKKVSYYFDADFAYLEQIVSRDNTILITDENVFARHKKKFKGWNTIVLKPGEAYKIQQPQHCAVNKQKERAVVPPANTRTEPWTMVVEF